jgi:DNA-binding NarL/FixJ family response regulator
MKKITVIIAEDHTIVRAGLCKVLEMDPGLCVIGEAADGRQAFAMAMDLKPDVILMDIAMPGLNGLEATRQLVKAWPKARVVILTAHNDDAYLQKAIEAGAVGFLLKQSSAKGVCEAIHEVYLGNMHFSSSVVERFNLNALYASRSLPPMDKNMSLLTSREMEVLQLIAEGKANKETAAELNISIRTVEKHRASLMEKLDIHDTASLTRHAIAAGIIESSVQTTIL